MTKKATVHDVAAASHASIATVSRVLSGSAYPVSTAMRTRILAAAEALHYLPNAVGKSLKTQTSCDLGVIVPNLTNPYYAMLLQGIYDCALAGGYHLILCNAARNAQEEARQLHALLEKRVAGILLASIDPQMEAVRYAMATGCPMVAMEQELPLSCMQVGFHFEKGAYMATEHLIAQGHTQIGFVGAPLDRPSRRQMLAGFTACMEAHALPLREAWVMLSQPEREQARVYEFANGEACAQAFLQRKARPTGYLCLNDMTALGLMHTFQTAGMRLPEDASVIGFDNILFCDIAYPPLTTIDQHAYEMGETAARMIIGQIEQPDRPQMAVRLEPTLVRRGSVGAP